MIDPANLDLSAWRNGYSQFDITLTSADSSAALDLTGYSALMQVRRTPGAGGDPFVSVQTDDATQAGSIITLPDPANGKISILIKEADFEGFPVPADPKRPAIYFYDLVLTAPGADPAPYMRGKFIFHEGVSRAD